MADVNALFASRKKKKSTKKKTTNFNTVLEEAMQMQVTQKVDPHTEVVVDYDSDGNPIIEIMPVVTVGGLTAAVNAAKLKDKDDKVLNPTTIQMANGEWIEEDDTTVDETLLLNKSNINKVADLESLQSQQAQVSEPSEDAESSKKLFHWTRKQALQGKTEAPVVEAEPEAPKFFRPRHVMEAKSRESGQSALKELNNDAVFPTLGDHKTTKGATKGVWGSIEEDSIEDTYQQDGEYLGSEFITANTFQGAKPGYSFKEGSQGLGYYWDCKAVEKEEVEEETPKEAPVVIPEVVVPEVKIEVPLTAEELAKIEKDRLEKEKKRQEKKKEKLEWERQIQLDKEREEVELLKSKDVVQNSTAVAAVVAEPPADRFAGLKKKKKKKATE